MSLWEPKVYRGSGLVTVKQEVVCSSTYMHPSPAVMNDVASGRLPRISIPTLDRSWMVPVRDAVINTFVESLDLKQAWLAGVRQSILVWHAIIDHIPSSNMCRCTGDSHASDLSHCGHCGRATICGTLTMGQFGYRVCRACSAKDKSRRSLVSRHLRCASKARISHDAPTARVLDGSAPITHSETVEGHAASARDASSIQLFP